MSANTYYIVNGVFEFSRIELQDFVADIIRNNPNVIVNLWIWDDRKTLEDNVRLNACRYARQLGFEVINIYSKKYKKESEANR